MRYSKWAEENAGETIRDYISDCRENGQRVDFSSADLRGADLRGADLDDASFRYANLEGTDLRGTDLIGANLLHANLDDADLRRTNLHRANLEDASLRRANLEGANLIRANLYGANLEGTNLQGADLRGAYLKAANLTNANVHGTIGLFSTHLVGLSTRNDSAETLLSESGRVEVRLGCHTGTLAQTLDKIQSAEYVARVGKEQSDLYAAVVAMQHFVTTELLQKRGVELEQYCDKERIYTLLSDLTEAILSKSSAETSSFS